MASVVSSATITRSTSLCSIFSELFISEVVRVFDDELTELASGKAW
jgi:hypothetical protein